MSRSLELPAIFEKRARSASNLDGATSTGLPAASQRAYPNSGSSVDLGYGIMHLYKDAPPEEGAVAHLKGEAASDQGCRTVAVLAVPSNWATADFLRFIANAVESIEQMRIMRCVAAH